MNDKNSELKNIYLGNRKPTKGKLNIK